MKKMILVLMMVALFACPLSLASADGTIMYVTASELNGRYEASTDSSIEAHFYYGDEVEAVSQKKGWIEVIGGECGTVWCKADYLTETLETLIYTNTSGARVRVRNLPEGDKRIRWIEENESVSVQRTAFGWGYVGDGYIDMSCFSLAEE